MTLTLRKKFLVIGLVSIIALIFMVTSTNRSMSEIITLNDELQKISTIAQRHMEGDMMHDAMRGDIANAVLAVKEGNAKAFEEAAKSFDAHASNFEKQVTANASTKIPEDIRGKMDEVKEALKAYTVTGKTIITELKEGKIAETSRISFTNKFEALESTQQEVSDMLTKWSEGYKTKVVDIENSAATESIALGCFSILLAIGIQFFVSLGILRPLNQMMEAMKKIADGETETAIPHISRKDEIGNMAHTVQVFKENALQVSKMAEQQVEQQKRATLEKKKAMEDLANNFEMSVKNVVDMVASASTQMDATARTVSGIADNSRNKLTELATEIDNTGRNVQTVASAATQLNSAIAEITQQVARASSVTSAAVDKAQSADHTVQCLVTASQKIGEVVSMINGIAEQINLLALNATIEAARAGDAGKGFAVVASEVKTLATQTTKATSEISAYIDSIQSATGDTVNVIKQISETIREINQISTTIAAAVEQQGVATKDIAHNVEQAASSTHEVSRSTEAVTVSANETGEAATQMTAATSELSKQAETLRSEVDKFLHNVRAA